MSKTSSHSLRSALFHPAVIVGALGYFVDIYDLILFGVVRVASLKDLGCVGDQIAIQGTWLINIQMAGMLLGGLPGDCLATGTAGSIFSSAPSSFIRRQLANGFVYTSPPTPSADFSPDSASPANSAAALPSSPRCCPPPCAATAP